MIDRRVRILGSDPRKGEITTISKIRDRVGYVLLGEPGIGKSTVFASEARHDGVGVLTVRALVHGFAGDEGSPLYLDGLDEYRVDGAERDKIYHVAKLLRELKPTRWRLSCRAEDWRKDADLSALELASGSETLLVAQLLPLLEVETLEVLASLGERDPKFFVAKALQVGAGGLLESPLSIKLLRTVVSTDGEWPTSRYSLFEQATRQYSFEQNSLLQRGSRASSKDILQAADRLSLLMLTTGARGIWRSNAPPPNEAEGEFVPANSTDLSPELVDDTLDTPMFTGGEGERFEYMHRTVAEFLAARGLADAVRGSQVRAAIPLGRALSLLSGPNGAVLSELRGVHAWLAAHLAVGGHALLAREVVETDPIGALAYGDASVLDHPTREALLEGIDRNDPYFLGAVTLDESTALGGLAKPDMTSAFLTVLDTPAETHKLALVLSVLEQGPKLEKVGDRLRKIALDPERPEWQRTRALRIWLGECLDRAAGRLEMLEAMSHERPSVIRETIRAKLISDRDGPIDVSEIKSLLGDFARSERDNVIMRLQPLSKRLASEPIPTLFDEPISAWLPDENARRQSHEVSRVLDAALSAAINADDGSNPERVWRWTLNVREDNWEQLEDKSAAAINRWIAVSDDREQRLFDAVIDSADPTERDWVPGWTWSALTGTAPSPRIVMGLFKRASEPSTLDGTRLVRIAIALAKKFEDPSDYFSAFDKVVALGDPALTELIASEPLDDGRRRQRESLLSRERRRADEQQALVDAVNGSMDGVRSGAAAHILDVLSHIFIGLGQNNAQRNGLAALSSGTNPEIAAAALNGFEAILKAGVPASAREIGALEANGARLHVELPMLAAVVHLVGQSAE